MKTCVHDGLKSEKCTTPIIFPKISTCDSKISQFQNFLHTQQVFNFISLMLLVAKSF